MTIQGPPEKYVKDLEIALKTRKPADGLSPECLPFLKEREKRLAARES